MRQESQQLDSPDKSDEEKLSKSKRKQWQRKDKRNREHDEDQYSGHTSDRFNQEDNTSIGLDSEDVVDKRRGKKTRKRKPSGSI